MDEFWLIILAAFEEEKKRGCWIPRSRGRTVPVHESRSEGQGESTWDFSTRIEEKIKHGKKG